MLWKYCNVVYTHVHIYVCACMHVYFTHLCCWKWVYKVPTQISTPGHPSRLLHHARTKTSNGNRFSFVPNSDFSNFLFASPFFLVFPRSRMPTQDCLVPLLYHFTCWLGPSYARKGRVWHCTGFWGQTEARPQDMPVWHPVRFSSRKDRYKHVLLLWQILGTRTLTPHQSKHLQLLQPVSSSRHQKHWQHSLLLYKCLN